MDVNSKNEFRITARIRRADGREKTVRFSGNAANMKKKMRSYFKAEEFKMLQFGEIKFSNTIPWESTKEDKSC